MTLTNEQIQNLINRLKELKLVFNNFEDEPNHEVNLAANKLIQFLIMLPAMDLIKNQSDDWTDGIIYDIDAQKVLEVKIGEPVAEIPVFRRKLRFKKEKTHV